MFHCTPFAYFDTFQVHEHAQSSYELDNCTNVQTIASSSLQIRCSIVQHNTA